MAKKKLYFKFSDNGDYSGIVMSLSGVMQWIKAEELDKKPEEEIEDIQYTLTPIMLTDRQYKNLPEADI